MFSLALQYLDTPYRSIKATELFLYKNPVFLCILFLLFGHFYNLSSLLQFIAFV
jgi:hypothetical protein